MKKLLLGACIIFSAIFSANAQLPYLQNFEASTINAPSGWGVGVASHHPGNPGWEFNNVFPTAGSSLFQSYTTTHTYCAFIDDIDYNTAAVNDYDTLYTSSFSCAGSSHVFISLDLNFNNYTGYEVGTIAVSTNGGATWSTAVNLPSGEGDVSWYNGQVFDITSYAAGQASVMLAFTWNCVGAVSNYGVSGWGMAIDNINVYAPLDYDVGVTSQTTPYLVRPLIANSFSGTISNYGGDSITAMTINYSVNGGAVVSQNVSSILVNRLSSYNYNLSSIPWTPPTAGTYIVKFWANNLNGSNADQNNANDTLTQTFLALDTIVPKTVLFEEFNQASCDPCADAKANVDSVCANNNAIMIPVRYHVNWPGTDYMNDETQTPFINARVSYYGVDGVPDGKLDGADIYPGDGYFNSVNVQPEAAIGTPIKISITSASYNPSTKTYSLNADIKSFAAFAAGLKAQTVLTVDTINYAANQSTESIPQYNFPEVAEDMMPSSSGTSLAAFTAGQTQSISVSWTKNHPWGYEPHTYTYDSTDIHLTVFVQDNAGIPALGIPAQYVFQAASVWVTVPTGLKEISKGVYFDLYPNPTDGNATVQFALTNEQNVTVELYNMLGEKLYIQNEGMMSNGEHLLTIPCSGLQSGVYFVKFTSDNASTTKKLVIQK